MKQTLTDRERVVLVAMSEHLPEGYAAPFRSINTYVRNSYPRSWEACEAYNIRRVVRSLARKGMTELIRGLFNDDGYLNGSGYGVTKKGREWFAAYLDGLPPPPPQEGEEE